MDMFEPTDGLEVPPPSSIVGVAINGSKRSAHALRWALVKFVPEGRTVFKLLYVCPSIQSVPTPMGNHVPISQVREDVADAYRSEMEWKTSSMLLPFKQLCARQKVDVEARVIEADDIALGISSEVSKLSITDLVIGASSSSMFAKEPHNRRVVMQSVWEAIKMLLNSFVEILPESCRFISMNSIAKLSNQAATRISEGAPKSCTVYVISKGKLLSVRSSNSETSESVSDRRSDTSSSVDSPLSYKSSLLTDQSSADPFSRDDPSFQNQSLHALLTMNKTLLNVKPAVNLDRTSFAERPTVNLDRTSFAERPTFNLDRTSSVESENKKKDIRSSYSMSSDTGHSRESSFRRFGRDFPSWDSDQESFADGPSNSPSSQIQEDSTFELERLKIELRHVRGMYAVAQNETINATRQLNNLSKRRTEEAAKLDEISSREERAREIVRQEMEKQEAVKREAEILMECLNREAAQRKKAESRAARDAKERENLEKALENTGHQNMKFTWEEIVSATSSFSEDLRIGKGAFGTVYKCTLHHVTAAVKVLHSKEGHNSKEFQQELEILSKIRHPHMVLLLGVCLDQGCLVYEYLENGSLEDRLFRKDNTPPIPWFERFRIAWEVASALLFLHSSKPKSIIHRDLKPANILLDQNLTSKIGDVGLSTSLNTMNSAMSSIYGKSGPVGTLCYIDPEYQRSGFFSPKSDVYAFGMVILQLLTAKPALALAYNVEIALDEGNLIDILDKEAGNWPVEETLELAILGMSCVELSLKDRPDLESQVLPVLERLKGVVDKAKNSAPSVQLAPPNHFLCPLLKEVMENPYVASDGYTYERKGIEQWFELNEKSPMTDAPFRDQNLTPNYTLLAAIMEWKCKTQ